MIEVVTFYSWPNDSFPLASLGVRVVDLALRLGVATQQWDVEGLGPARGIGFRTANGRVYLIGEVELSVAHSGVSGPGVYVDAAELAMVGSVAIIEEVVAELGLIPSDVVWVADADAAAEKFTAELVTKVANARANSGE